MIKINSHETNLRTRSLTKSIPWQHAASVFCVVDIRFYYS